MCLVALGCAPEQMLAGPQDGAVPDVAVDASSDARDASDDAAQVVDAAVDARPPVDGPPAWCPAGVADCDGDRVTCEARLLEDADHCGACGNRCVLGWVCSNGMCRPAPADAPATDASADASDGSTADAVTTPCPDGLIRCFGACVDPQTDVDNCGGCDWHCGAGQLSFHLVATCTAGRCGATCQPGWADCSRNTSDGCETPLDTVVNCGACGRTCARTQTCQRVSDAMACR